MTIDSLSKYSTELTQHQLSWATVNHGCADLNNILGLIDLVLSLPATSVRNECLFSTMKLVRGKRRGRLANSTLDDLLLIAVQSPPISDFDPDDAIFHWMSTPGSRRFNYTRQKKDTKVRERSESVVIVDEIFTVATTENVDEVPVNSIESTDEINDETGLDNVPFRDEDEDSDGDIEESDESDNEQSIYENTSLITKYREMEMELEYDL
ncbi:uncharacterized protein LOC134248845 [Saccostrea cucullata]|uniref:uncharacterized protein LOC134248845 n=1 Tax=Saccostrea cuccullata TaxID=36930 RepID=UPI002ED5F9F0